MTEKQKKTVTLTPYSKYGENENPKENYKQPFFKKWGNGKWPEGFAIKFMLVATANFDMFSLFTKWKMTRNQNVNYDKKDNINVPLRARDINLTGLPKDAFKAKVEAIEGGKLTIAFTIGEHTFKFVLTYEDALKYRNNIGALAMTFDIPEAEEIPDDEEKPEPITPDDEKPKDEEEKEVKKMKWYQKRIESVHKFFHKHRKYVVPIFGAIILFLGFDIAGLHLLSKFVSKLIVLIFGFLMGTYIKD